MMQRLFLIPDSEGKGTFDALRLSKALLDLIGITNCKEGEDSPDPEGTLFECELETGDATVPVPFQIRKDLRIRATISCPKAALLIHVG